MSEVAIFSIGSVMFVATTWATISFGMSRMHELRHRDVEASGGRIQLRESGLTELHSVNPPVDPDATPTSTGGPTTFSV